MKGAEPAPLIVVCQDCGVEWGVVDRPPPCFAAGHRHTLLGIPVLCAGAS